MQQFDYDTISDVILHISYTALEGGEKFKKDREKKLKDRLNALVEVAGTKGLARAFSFPHEFPNEWHRLRQGQEISLTIGLDRLPYFARVLDPKIEEAMWLAKMVKPGNQPKLTVNGTDLQWGIYVAEPWFATKKAEPTSEPVPPSNVPLEPPVTLTLKAPDATEMEALLLIVTYHVQKQA